MTVALTQADIDGMKARPARAHPAAPAAPSSRRIAAPAPPPPAIPRTLALALARAQVTELKEALTKYGLSIKGVKKDLAARLSGALNDGTIGGGAVGARRASPAATLDSMSERVAWRAAA